MSTEDIVALSSRIRELENRLKYVYEHLQIEFPDDFSTDNSKVVELVKTGNKIEAIKFYRELYNVGLAEAKDEIEKIEKKYL